MVNSRFGRWPNRWALTSQSLLFLTLCAAAPGLHAKDPYQVVSMDFGGDVFNHLSSSANTPTGPCPVASDGSITFGENACAEQFSTVGGFSMGMGVRAMRHLQIDPFNLSILGDFGKWGQHTASFTCVSGCTTQVVTTRTISSVSLLVTTGARVVWPVFHERLLLSAGGGFAALSSFQRAQAGGNEQVQCTTCQSVSGHGPTGVAEVLYMFQKHIGVGLHVRYVNIGSSGLTLASEISGGLVGTKYRDGFFLTGAEISLRFGTHH